MKNSGISFKRLIVAGKDKENAIIVFGDKLTVITGPSNTGKTYIYEALNYILGGKKPKNISESEGYTDFILEISTTLGDTYTLCRSLNSSKIQAYHAIYEEHKDAKVEILLSTYKKTNPKNISTFLCNLSGIHYRAVIKNAEYETFNFSYRDLIRLSMVSEGDISYNESVLYASQHITTKTKLSSMLRVMLTGKDDLPFIPQKELQDIPVDIKTKYVSELKSNILNLFEADKTLQKLTQKYETDNLEEIKEGLSAKAQVLDDLQNSKRNLNDEVKYLDDRIDYYSVLINRFKLLEDNYFSDLKRLTFIEESRDILGQFIDVKCPTCGTNIENNMNNNNNIIIHSIQAEIKKIYAQLSDLATTIVEAESTCKSIKLDLEFKMSQKEKLHQQIQQLYDQDIINDLNKLQQLFQQKAHEEERENLLNLMNTFIEENITLDNKADTTELENYNKQKEKYSFKLDSAIIDRICKIVTQLLDKFGLFIKPQVTWDMANVDLIINGKEKNTYGKGYSALINTALILAIHIYMKVENLPIPGYIVIDSPLTAFKDKKYREGINESVKGKFFETLSKIRGLQIIVLDNQEPNLETQNRITYYYFEGEGSTKRNGFFSKSFVEPF